MPGGLKQPAKGFKLARGTPLQKANTAKKEAIKFRLLTVFETKMLFVVRNGSCHKNLNGNFIWDKCMSVISLVDEDQMQTQAGRIQQRVSCLCRLLVGTLKRQNTKTREGTENLPSETQSLGKHWSRETLSVHLTQDHRQGEQTKDAGRQMLNIHKEGQWWKMRQLGRMRQLNRRNKTRGANRKAKHKQLKINQEMRYLKMGKMQMQEWTKL